MRVSGSALTQQTADFTDLEDRINEAGKDGYRVVQMCAYAYPASTTGGRVPQAHTDSVGTLVLMERACDPSNAG